MKQRNRNKLNQTQPHKNTNHTKAAPAAVAATRKPMNKWWFLPLAFTIAIIPLITVIHSYDCGIEDYPWFSIGGVVYDFFLYYKAFFLRLAGVVILFILAWRFFKKDFGNLNEKRSLPPMIAIGIFGLFSLASALLAEHTDDALWGGYEQFEGWFVILTYIACFFLAFGYAKTLELIRFLLDVVLFGALLIGILGSFQAIGKDWIQSGWAKPILTSEIAGETDVSSLNIQLNFGVGMSYATLYNPNYVGSYVSLVLPYTLYLILRGEKLWRRALAVAASIMLLITLFASQSLTGLFGLAVGGFLCLLLILPYLKKLRIFVIAGMGVTVIASVAFMYFGTDILTRLIGEPIRYTVDSITNDENRLHIVFYDGSGLEVAVNPDILQDRLWAADNAITDTLTVTDYNGAPIHTTFADKLLTLDQAGYPGMSFCYEVIDPNEDQPDDEFSVLHVKDAEFDWAFLANDGKLMHYTDFGRADNISKVNWSGFDGHWFFASRRGYIWSRTIPMLSDNLFLGIGRDNFIYKFPNNDYVGKRYLGYSVQTITKPHDMFLQIWVQDGLPALIAFLFLYILLLIRVIRLNYRKDRPDPGNGITFHSFAVVSICAVTSYIVVGLANDSTITVAPVFWCMLGAGYAAEAAIRRSLAKKA